MPSAASGSETDWPRILDCYDALVALTRSPIVALNRAIARSQVEGPRPRIAEVERSPSGIRARRLSPAAGRPGRAVARGWRPAAGRPRYYRAALALAGSAPEQRFLAARLASLGQFYNRCRPVEYLIKQYPVETGALEIQYIEEFFGEFPRRKTAAEIIARLQRPRVADADGGSAAARRSRHARAGVVQGRARGRPHEHEPKLRDLVEPPGRRYPLRRPPHSVFVDRRARAATGAGRDTSAR